MVQTGSDDKNSFDTWHEKSGQERRLQYVFCT